MAPPLREPTPSFKAKQVVPGLPKAPHLGHTKGKEPQPKKTKDTGVQNQVKGADELVYARSGESRHGPEDVRANNHND